ncbi:MAG: late competence development ComFB family protein [Treponema sp.]|nr:late competence development ComFB family protein [Treponema sp.]
MALTEKYNFDLLKNEAEKLVFAELERQLESYEGDLCTCNDCVVDMAAIALNAVKPLYHFSILGNLYSSQAMDDEEYGKTLKDAVTAAIEKVRRNPSHD